MTDVRPFVQLKLATSIDGYVDDFSPRRLILSSPEDIEAVQTLRAEFDAILIGAETVRKDNPRLLISSGPAQKRRLELNLPPTITKVTFTASGNLPRDNNFFQSGNGKKLVYATNGTASKLNSELGELAEVVPVSGSQLEISFLLNDLFNRGIRKLLVEGGAKVAEAFLHAGVVDRFRLAIAPIVLADAHAPRFSLPAGCMSKIDEVKQHGQMMILNLSFPPPS